MKRRVSPPLDFRNPNSLWGSVLVETLYRLGLRQAVISPGSRSTPLTMAFARHPGIESIAVLDERSAAFFALGLARQHHRPVVLVCTSGTAGANYYPAVIEARESGVPLLVITADRPPELRDCRSGQTIDQQKLYGNQVNFYHEFAVPAADLARLRYLRQTTAHAWARSQWPFAGPVHLNAPFRDPLPPVADASTRRLRPLLRPEIFFAGFGPQASPAPVAVPGSGEGWDDFGGVSRGLVIVGQMQPADPLAQVRAIGRLSAALGWPVLADALSPLRNHQQLLPHLVTTYDLVARSAKLRRDLKPERVLCFSGWPTSKALRHWLEAADPEVLVAGLRPANEDALHLRTRVVRHSVEALAELVKPVVRKAPWLQHWIRTEKMFTRKLSRALLGSTRLFEGRVSQSLPGLLPRGTTVFVANSMPVRDAEYFWPANDSGHTIHCNRGANGIDGTLSTALGVAHGARPAVLLTGDLALLHDTNGFLLHRKFTGSLTIILINNRGGGIFEHLPVAQFNPPFEEFFATPQAVDFRRLCAAYGVHHVAVKSWAQFGRLVSTLPARGIRVLEMATDRKSDAAWRQDLFARLASAAG